ncbi:thermonuclease family protein [Agrobacterium sp. CG674]
MPRIAARSCLLLGCVFFIALPFSVGAIQPIYQRCGSGLRLNCIVDGDTLWSSGVKIRIADIDTPEISQPRCAAEKTLGDRATLRLMELVNAGPFQMQAWHGRNEDKYGRKLRMLVREGRSIGDMLVSEGLARTWTGKRQPWC